MRGYQFLSEPLAFVLQHFSVKKLELLEMKAIIIGLNLFDFQLLPNV